MTIQSTSEREGCLARIFDELVKLTKKLGLETDEHWGFDVDFEFPRINLGITDEDDDNMKEERLCHELGHYLVAPPHRRKKSNYGISRIPKPQADREELAAAVLGMLLQKHFKSGIDMDIDAYLWNSDPRKWKYGFWIGAEMLLDEGWMKSNFTLNVSRLQLFINEEVRK